MITSQTILMCEPGYFGVEYVINPWMRDQAGKVDRPLAERQWQALRTTLAEYVRLAYVPPEPGVPDMVFTANAGLVHGERVIVSRFQAPERRREEPHLRRWFAGNGYTIVEWPDDVAFEGAGDALFDRGQPLLWVGYGFRSDAAAARHVERSIGCRTVPLRLVDPRFYHLDTCLCPLEGGWLLYYPAAFDGPSQAMIRSLVPETKRIEVSEADALQFACNAVNIDGIVILNGASPALQDALRRAGFTPILIALSEFMKSGGAAKCLTLRLTCQ